MKMNVNRVEDRTIYYTWVFGNNVVKEQTATAAVIVLKAARWKSSKFGREMKEDGDKGFSTFSTQKIGMLQGTQEDSGLLANYLEHFPGLKCTLKVHMARMIWWSQCMCFACVLSGFLKPSKLPLYVHLSIILPHSVSLHQHHTLFLIHILCVSFQVKSRDIRIHPIFANSLL